MFDTSPREQRAEAAPPASFNLNAVVKTHNERTALVVIVLLLAAGAIAGVLSDARAGIGVGIYSVAAACAFVFAQTSARASQAHRLLTQLAALVCLSSARALDGNVSATLSVGGVLLFIHALLLARLPHRFRLHRTT